MPKIERTVPRYLLILGLAVSSCQPEEKSVSQLPQTDSLITEPMAEPPNTPISPTLTETLTPTPTPTKTPTLTQTLTETPTPLPTPTATPTLTPTSTPSPTETLVPPTATPSPIPPSPTEQLSLPPTETPTPSESNGTIPNRTSGEDSARKTGRVGYFDREVFFCIEPDGSWGEDTDSEGHPNGVLSLVTHVHDVNPSAWTVGVYVAPGGPVVYYPASEIRIMDHPVEQTPANYFPGTLSDLEENDCVLLRRADNFPGEVTPENDTLIWGFR